MMKNNKTTIGGIAAKSDQILKELESKTVLNVPHLNGSLEKHLKAVFNYLLHWRESEDVCFGGLLHSVYGTEHFKRTSISIAQRDKVKRLAGERAERLAYYFSVTTMKDMDQFDLSNGGETFNLTNRLSWEIISVTRADFLSLLNIHMANYMEQHIGLKWIYSDPRLIFYRQFFCRKRQYLNELGYREFLMMVDRQINRKSLYL